MLKKKKIKFSEIIINWYNKNKRKLPWRKTKDPYKIWVSEIILQQTRISQGTSYYLNFIEKYPKIENLATEKEDNILKIWQGLGYYSRAINMHKTAKFIYNEKKNIFPKKYNDLIKLKGVGPYTAAAISSICFKEKRAVLDGNVLRILSRYFKINDPINSNFGIKKFTKLSNKLVSESEPGNYNQGMMDLGSAICKPKNPLCDLCPLNISCESKKEEKFNLPNKLKLKKNKTRYLVYLIMKHYGKYYVKKRLSNDIWGNLYDFPHIEFKNSKENNDKNILIKLKNMLKNKDIVINQKVSINYKLTHQNLNISFVTLTGNIVFKSKKFEIVSKNKLMSLPVPKPIENFISNI